MGLHTHTHTQKKTKQTAIKMLLENKKVLTGELEFWVSDQV